MSPTRFRTASAISLLSAVVSAPATAAPPTLLADLNTQAVAASSSPARVAWAPGSSVPSDLAIIRTTPLSLWLTDGTPGGARRLDGTLPSNLPSSGFTVNAARTASGRIAVVSSFTSQTAALYGIDAAAAHAALLIESPTLSSTILPAGDRFVFVHTTAAVGRELWVTDGTAQGTSLLADLVPGPSDSTPTLMTSTGALAWFTVKRNTVDPRELWVTDGTLTGTRAIGPLSPTSATPSFIAAAPLGGGIVYAARDTGASADSIYTVNPTGTPQALTAAGLALAHTTGPIVTTGTHVLFTASVNNVAHLYVSDGTSANTTPISETVLLVSTDHAVAVDPAAPLGWRVYFPGGTSVNATEPCVTNGTRPGTSQIADLILGTTGTSPRGFTALGTRAVLQTVSYVSETFSYVGTTYLTDGTSAGTIDLAPVTGAPQFPSPIIALGGRVLLSGRDSRGSELWAVDGTPAFEFLDELNPRTASASSPLTYPGDDQATLISADNGTTFQALFLTNGTSEGTVPVTSPFGTIAASLFSCPQQVAALPDRFIAFAGNPATGEEPWSIDRTTGAATLLRDIFSGAAGSAHTNAQYNCNGWFTAAQVGTRGVFVTRATPGFNREYSLWSTDGVPGGPGTVELAAFKRELLLGTGPLFNFTPVEDRAYFIAPALSTETSITDNDLWVTNGTSVQRAVDLSAAGVGVPLTLVAWNDRLHFVAATISSGLGRIFALSDQNAPTALNLGTVANALSIQWALPTSRGLVFQAIHPGTSPLQASLWITNGTPETTVQLTTPQPNFQPTSFMDAPPRIFFALRDADHGRELWTSDGTVAGTHVAADIAPGPVSSEPSSPRDIGGGRIAFSAYSPEFGFELWQSDGTAFGTRRISDIAPGTSSSYPGGLRKLGERVIFSADDQGSLGRELWVWDITPVCRCDLNNSGQPTLQDLFNYLGLFFTSSADFNNDGATTVQDIFDFLTCWFGGCV